MCKEHEDISKLRMRFEFAASRKDKRVSLGGRSGYTHVHRAACRIVRRHDRESSFSSNIRHKGKIKEESNSKIFNNYLELWQFMI